MRTLMLHGHATSAFIFKAQTVPFRGKLDKSYSFDFINGPVPCAPPPGLKAILPTAFTWCKGTDVDSIRESAKWLGQYIEKNGPYDSICCFSKAAVPVLAMLMYESRENHEVRRPKALKSIIFINGSLDYSFLEDLGLAVSDEARDLKHETEELVRSKGDALSSLASTLVRGASNGLWDDTSMLRHDPTKVPSPTDCFGLDFSSMPQDIAINIPTVHIVGAKDPIWPSGIQLMNLCDPTKRTLYDHKGGHDLPRTPKVANDIAKIFQKLARTTRL